MAGTLSAGMLKVPQGLFFSKNHTWAHLERSGIAKIGLDDLLLHLTGDLRVINHAKPGEIVRKGGLLAQIDHYGKQLKIFSPISGEIKSTNTALKENPEILQEDPFRSGWIYQIKPSDWISETRSCYLAGEATNWMTKELSRFKDFVMVSTAKNSPGTAGIILQDGGEIRENILAELPNELWQDFQRDFLDSTE